MIKIGDFANMFGVSIKTVRFYEEKKLLKPAYVDIYTGYRYYDENNIDEMSKILTYKSLGFELSEIKDVKDQTIINKINEYKNRITKMYLQIDALNTLLDSKEEVNMKTFINDENAIGKWSLIGISNTIEDYNNNKLLDESIAIKELYLMDGGKEYWVISWTKGYIYINNKPYSYEIKDDLMFVNLTGLYNNDNKVAVYKRVDNKHYLVEEIMHLDNTDIEFIEDKNINGLWKCVGYTSDKNDIKLNDGIIDRLSFFPNGEGNITFNNNHSRSISYTKGYIKDFGFNGTMSSYEIKDNYLIIEWKSGDYVFGGFISCYYVFEKVNV